MVANFCIMRNQSYASIMIECLILGDNNELSDFTKYSILLLFGVHREDNLVTDLSFSYLRSSNVQ